MTRTDTRLYYSKRGRDLPLVYHGDPPSQPTLTVENYSKWYDLYVVHTDGSVSVVEHDLVTEAWADHNFKPWICHRLAAVTEYVWHEESLEMVIGRYATEIQQIPWYCDDAEPEDYIYLLYVIDPAHAEGYEWTEEQRRLVCASSQLAAVKTYYRRSIRKGVAVELRRIIDGRDASTTCTKLDPPARQDSGRTVPE